MQLKEISIQTFRNYENTKVLFAEKINCFIGKNGSGKTNLLDSIHILCLSKSHLTHLDKENIKHLESRCSLSGTFIKNEFHDTINCIIEENKKKIFQKNDKQYEKISDHIGIFPLILIAPSDIFALLSNRKLRLKLIDNIISQTNKKYLNALINYNKLLENRNSALKQNNKSCQDLISIYDDELAKYGTFIFNKRDNMINELSIQIDKYYKDISKNSYSIDIKYKSAITSLNQYLQQLSHQLQLDMALGHTSFGIHRDDIEFNINGYNIQKFASQGQQKSFIIALKLAQYDYIHKLTNIKPILLLDDILDKLDFERTNSLIKKIITDDFGQTFITNTNAEPLYEYLKETNNDIKFFLIENGRITEYKH
ncbi:MAG: DNA replication/repair protein RecF [Solitalea-like symbiont of Acarus siro]